MQNIIVECLNPDCHMREMIALSLIPGSEAAQLQSD